MAKFIRINPDSDYTINLEHIIETDIDFEACQCWITLYQDPFYAEKRNRKNNYIDESISYDDLFYINNKSFYEHLFEDLGYSFEFVLNEAREINDRSTIKRS